MSYSYGMDILGASEIFGATKKKSVADQHFTAGTTGAGLGTRQLTMDTAWMDANAPASPPALAVVEAPIAPAPAPAEAGPPKSAEQKKIDTEWNDARDRYNENLRKLADKATASADARAAAEERDAYMAALRAGGPPPASRKSVTEEAWFWPAVGIGVLGIGFLGYKAFSGGGTRGYMVGGAR